MIEARGLRKVYPSSSGVVEAVVDLSLNLSAGEFTAIRGRSGSGKSTLLAMLGGLARPTAGEVYYQGTNVWLLGPDALADWRGRRVGFVFQSAELLPTLRTLDNVALPALIAGMDDSASIYNRAGELLVRLGLGDRAAAYPGELSGGQQRRVAVARALINTPALLLADEPTGDLDEEAEVALFRLLLDVRRSQGMALLVVTHNPEVSRLADRVLHLQAGRIVGVEESGNAALVGESAQPSRLQTLIAAADRKPPVGQPMPATSPDPLGSGLARFLAAFAAWMGIALLTVGALNYTVMQYRKVQERKVRSAEKRLQEAALYRLRAEVGNVAYVPEGSYRLTVSLQNTVPDQDLFVLVPTVRVFVQVGPRWEEVPARPVDQAEGRVLRLSGKQLLDYDFKPEFRTFEELIPGYMHVRITNPLLVARSADAGDGLFERTDDYYIYLKPSHADDTAILRKTRYPGKPPVWIPMPSH